MRMGCLRNLRRIVQPTKANRQNSPKKPLLPIDLAQCTSQVLGYVKKPGAVALEFRSKGSSNGFAPPLVFTIVPGEGSFYEIEADGTGRIEAQTEIEAPPGAPAFSPLTVSFAFISARVNDDPSLITGFIERLPLEKLRGLPEPAS